jgi:chemotaxis protein MotA
MPPIGTIVGMIAVMVVWPEFADLPSLLITLGGSAIVTSFSYSKRQWLDLFYAIHGLCTEKRYGLAEHVDELTLLTRVYRLEGLRGLESRERYLSDGYLKKGVGMVVDLQREESIQAKLERELAAFLSQAEIARQILLTLGRMLPAFGLIGTLIGMVLLLRNISSHDPQSLTTAVSIAVLTTLYGAIFANIFVSPLAARLQSVAVEKEMKMRLTLQWVLMLLRGQTATVFANGFHSLVPPARTADIPQDQGWAPMILPSH